MFKHTGSKAGRNNEDQGVGKFQQKPYGVGKMMKSTEVVKKGMAPPVDFSNKKV